MPDSRSRSIFFARMWASVVVCAFVIFVWPAAAQEPGIAVGPTPENPAEPPAEPNPEPPAGPNPEPPVDPVPHELPPAIGGPSPWESVEAVARLRYPELTPDGQTLVFTYESDMYRVPLTGGVAVPLTAHVGRELRGVTSPDGREIFYAGIYHGNYDVFAIPTAGGRARRITHSDASDYPSSISPDGRWLLYYAWRDGTTDLFLARTDGTGTPIRLTDTLFTDEYSAKFSPDGRHIALCVYGNSTSFFRPDYRGEDDGEIWVATLDGATLTDWRRITTNDWHDADPAWFDVGGRPMLVFATYGPTDRGLMICDPFDAPETDGGLPPTKLVYRTPNFRRPIRCLTIAPTASGFTGVVEDGVGGLSRVRYEFGHDAAIAEPIEISVTAMPKLTDESRVNTTGDVSEFAISPDGKKLAYVVNGDVFVTAADGSTDGVSLRLTTTPARELHVCWAPDSQHVLYTSLRRGNQDIVGCEIATGDERFLVATDTDECGAQFSPDSQWVAYVREERELRLIKFDGTDDHLFFTGLFPRQGISEVSNYRFAPDGRWLAVASTSEADLKREIFIGEVGKHEAPARVTAFAGNCYYPTWTADGKFLTFSAYINSDYDGYAIELNPAPAEFPQDKLRELFPVPEPKPEGNPPAENGENPPAQPPAKPAEKKGAKVAVEIDFTNIVERVRPITRFNSHEWNLMLAGDSWVFQADILNGYQFWSLPKDGGTLKQLTNQSGGKDYVQLSADAKSVFYLRGGRVQRLTIANGNIATVATRAEYEIDRHAERLAVYDEIGWVMRHYFYDPEFAQTEWPALHAEFRPLVMGATEDDVFRSVVSELLGQINYSHLGVGGRPGGTPGVGSTSTGDIGVRFDTAEQMATGRLRITHVFANSAADAPGAKLTVGDYIWAVNGSAVDAAANFDKLMANLNGQRVEITVGKVPADAVAGLDEAAIGKRTVVLKPGTRREIYDLRYEEWVRQNRARVEALSNGDFGYVHVRAMDGSSLTRFRNEVAGMMGRKKGIVIDVRNNGGGSTAVNILDILYKETWLLRTYRDVGRVSENMYRDEGWEKPAVAMCNQNSFSNAEIFTEGFQRLRIGPVIGMPTGGGVIGTSSFTLLDGSSLRTPFAGAFTVDMEDLERNPRQPDIFVGESPADRAANRDPQLERAVRELRKQALFFAANGERPYARRARADVEPLLEKLLADWEKQREQDAAQNGGDGDGGGNRDGE